jgi:hypothetical protein
MISETQIPYASRRLRQGRSRRVRRYQASSAFRAARSRFSSGEEAFGFIFRAMVFDQEAEERNETKSIAKLQSRGENS